MRCPAHGPMLAWGGTCVFHATACSSAVLEICKHQHTQVHFNVHRELPCRPVPYNFTACSEITQDTHPSPLRLTSCARLLGTGPSQTINSQYLHETCESMGMYRPSFCWYSPAFRSMHTQIAAFLEAYKYRAGEYTHTHNDEVGIDFISSSPFLFLSHSLRLRSLGLFLHVGG